MQHAGRASLKPKTVHACPYCSYVTPKKSHMIEHIRVHTGERPFACTQCPYRGATNGKLRKHLVTHDVLLPPQQPNGAGGHG